MAKKTTKNEDLKRAKLEKASVAVRDFMQLCSFLFGDNAPYEMNEIESDSPYYKLATELADEMEIDWKKMQHSDSNRLMLALLDEYFQNIREQEDETVVVEIKAKSIEKKEVKSNAAETVCDEDSEG